jgi:hypothetical protein
MARAFAGGSRGADPPKPTARWTDSMGIIIGCLAVVGSAGTIFGTTYSLRGEVSSATATFNEFKSSFNDFKSRAEPRLEAINDLKLDNSKAHDELKSQMIQISTKLDELLRRLDRVEGSTSKAMRQP